MRKSLLFVVSLLIVLSTLVGRTCSAQSLGSLMSRLEASDTDTAKENALTALIQLEETQRVEICSPSAAVQTRRALIAALRKENSLIFGSSRSQGIAESFSETEMEYYAGLVGCVSRLRDLSALHELIGAIQTGGGAVNGIVALGEPAVFALIGYLQAPRDRGRVPALIALGRLASRAPFPGSAELPPAISKQAATAVRARLLMALDDSNSIAREVAIESLTPYRDAEVIRAIERKAATDPSCVDTEAGKRYPVREVAQAWLRQNR